MVVHPGLPGTEGEQDVGFWWSYQEKSTNHISEQNWIKKRSLNPGALKADRVSDRFLLVMVLSQVWSYIPGVLTGGKWVTRLPLNFFAWCSTQPFLELGKLSAEREVVLFYFIILRSWPLVPTQRSIPWQHQLCGELSAHPCSWWNKLKRVS